MGMNNLFAQDFKPSVGKADQLVYKKKFAEAKPHVDALIKDEKKATKEKVWFLYGQVYQGLECSENPEDQKLIEGVNATKLAVDAYDKVLELKPHKSMFDNQVTMQVQDTRNPGALLDAAKPTLYKCLYDRVNVLYNGKEYAKALAILQKAALVDPKDTNTYAFMGYSAFADENSAALKEATKGYYENGGTTMELYTQLVNLLVREKKYSDAENVANEALTKFPGDIAMLKAKFVIYDEQDQCDKSIEVLKQLIEANPKDDVMMFRLGYAYGDCKEDNEKSMEYYEKALVLNPTSFEANFNAASLYVDQADDMRRVINKKMKENTLQTGERDKMLAESDEYLKKAKDKMMKCYNMKPSDETVILYLTDIFNMLGDDANYEKFKAKLPEDN